MTRVLVTVLFPACFIANLQSLGVHAPYLEKVERSSYCGPNHCDTGRKGGDALIPAP
jgi:hypothetical protein